MSAVEGISILLYLDVNVDLWIAPNLRERAFDCVHAHELGHDRLNDEQRLSWATNHG